MVTRAENPHRRVTSPQTSVNEETVITAVFLTVSRVQEVPPRGMVGLDLPQVMFFIV
jgi:hypothetical protein